MEEFSIAELQDKMTRGEITSRELTYLYLERIALLDQSGPGLNAVLELNPDALSEAARLDKERAAGQVRGPLHGVPLLLKANIDTADRMATTSGSLALAGWRAPQDAFIVARLREAGALLLGKTNLSEWANFRSTHSVSGWSSLGGQTHNPYALDRSPCGSSSGSGVAAAANLCAAAVGTETDGSIICPAQTNGIVGIKPTLGLLSRSGIIPIAHSQDTAGPMARSVADAAALLGAMTGVDPDDPATAASQDHSYNDYTAFLKRDGLRGARIGVARCYFGDNRAVDALLESHLTLMKAQGAELIDVEKLGEADTLEDGELVVLLYEFKADLNAYLSRTSDDYPHSMAEVIAFNETHREQVMPYFGQEHMLAAQEKGSLSDEAYQIALEANQRKTRAEGIDWALQEYQLDALVAPTGDPAWPIDYANGNSPGGGGFSGAAAVSGYPHITVPAGFVRGLPVGLSFFGTAYSEPTLLRLAYAFEQTSQARRAPQFLQHSE